MSHSINQVWIHALWATKERQKLIGLEIESEIHELIKQEFNYLSCRTKIINGMADHIHCLFLLNQQKSISEVMKHVKGSTSHIINHRDLITEKFSWQTGYAAFSVSESDLDRVYFYIRNQKQHHLKAGFDPEQEF